MGAIKDKLDAEWTEKQVDENMFAVRAIIEDFYNNLERAISEGSDLYPTGDSQFDAYVQPIVSEMTAFKTQLEDNYAEFIRWRQP